MKKFLAILLLFSALITQAQESFFRGNNNFVAPTLTVPTLAATTAASSITRYSANSGGSILSNGGSTILESGICWGTSTPTISNNKTTDGGSIGNFTSTLSGLTAGINYYVRAYATNSTGTSYGSVQTFTTTPTVIIPAVGASYGGGIVGYVYQNGDPGFTSTNIPILITSTTPQGLTRWFNGSSIATGATASILGSGFANTNTIITSQGASTGGLVYAAALARNYTGGGFTDWYLPSQDELNKLYINRTEIGGYTNAYNYFWASTEVNASLAKLQNFLSGGAVLDFGKNATGGTVRAVRTIALSPIITPIITTSTSSGITATEASITSSVTDEGLTQVSSRGFVYGTTTGSSTFSVTNGSGAGSYTSTLSGLTSATTYYVRSFATNTQGTAYGAEISFTTATPAPAIVSSGLLLNLDAGNTASYPGSGTTWTNLVTGNAVTSFTINGNVTYNAANGGVLRFADGGLASTSNSLGRFTKYSIETWVKIAGTSGSYPCLFTESVNQSIGGANMILGYNTGFGTANQYASGFNSSSWNVYTTTTNISDTNNWVQIVATYDGNICTIYKNGVYVGSGSIGSSGINSANLGYNIGKRWDQSNYVYGDYSVVRLYNRDLSSSEVSANFDALKSRFGL